MGPLSKLWSSAALQLLTNTRDAQVSLRYSDRRCAARRLMPSAMSIPWCCPSMIYAVFICDDYHLLFPALLVSVIWFVAAHHDGIHSQTMITCDAWWLTMKVPDVRRGYDLLLYIFVNFVFFVWHGKHSPLAFVFKGLDSSAQIRTCSRFQL